MQAPPINHRSPPSIQSNDIEMHTPRASTSASAAGAIIRGSPEALEGLKGRLTTLFEGHKTAENAEEIETLVNDRATKMHALDYLPDEIDQLMEKAERMDRVTVPTQGAVGGLPFGVATVVLDKVPDVTADATGNPAYTGFIAGAVSGAADAVGTGLLKTATEDTLWLKAPNEMLEPVMEASQKAKAEANPGKQVLQSAAAFQTFTVRNAVRLGVAATLNATLGPKAAAAADTVIGSVGGMAAGAGYAAIMHKNNKAAGLVGGAQFFGRKDWEKQLQVLKYCSPSRDPLINGAKRAAKLPLDIASNTLSSLRDALTASSLVANGGALGGGFALTTLARGAVKTAAAEAGMTPGAVSALDHLTNVAGSAATFSAYGAAGVLTGPAADKGVKVIQEDIPPKTLELANSAQAGIAKGARATGEFAGDTYTSAREGLNTLATNAGEALSSGATRGGRVLSSGTEAVGNIALSGANLLGDLAHSTGLRRRPAPMTEGGEQV